MSVTSMIDMDLAIPEPIRPPFAETTRPGTAASNVSDFSAMSEAAGSSNPFEYERHPSLYLDSDAAPVVGNHEENQQEEQEETTPPQPYPAWYLAEHPELAAGGSNTQRGQSPVDLPRLDPPNRIWDRRHARYAGSSGAENTDSNVSDDFSETTIPTRHRREESFAVYDMDADDTDTGYQTSSSLNTRLEDQRYVPPPLPYQARNLTPANPHQIYMGYRMPTTASITRQLLTLHSLIPNLPPPPSAATMNGTATEDQIQQELQTMLEGFSDQLGAFKGVYSALRTSKSTDRPPRRQ